MASIFSNNKKTIYLIWARPTASPKDPGWPSNDWPRAYLDGKEARRIAKLACLKSGKTTWYVRKYKECK